MWDDNFEFVENILGGVMANFFACIDESVSDYYPSTLLNKEPFTCNIHKL